MHSTSQLNIKPLCNQPNIHRVIRRATNSSLDPSNNPYIINLCTDIPSLQSPKRLVVHSSVIHPNRINLCTDRPSFQPLKHPIVHPSTKLSIYSVIHTSGMNLSIHLTNQPAKNFFQSSEELFVSSTVSFYQPSIHATRLPSTKPV